MVRELHLARRPCRGEAFTHGAEPTRDLATGDRANNLSSCAHRAVAKDGRIVCAKIVEGDNEVSPNVCRACPVKAVNCTHLRFSLRHTSSSPLIVRYNGHTEIWNDVAPELRFERAACTARVIPIVEPRSCAACPLRTAVKASAEPPDRHRPAPGLGKVVPFPRREALAPTG